MNQKCLPVIVSGLLVTILLSPMSCVDDDNDEPDDIVSDWWKPAAESSIQLQYDGQLDQTVDAEVYDIDLFDSDAGVVEALHQQGRRVLCYINVGAWEDWRPDQDDFPPAVLGQDYEGWPGERWLDIRRIDLLAPIIGARFDECKAKGFDGIDPDNINGYTNDTGFPLTYQDQLAFNIWLADEAHARGLAIGLKNDTEQAADLEPHFDWVLTESCLAEGWCDEAAAFLDAGKPLFAIEYTDTVSADNFLDELCPQAENMGASAVLKNRELDAWLLVCP